MTAPLFTIASFIGAFLLFWSQPLMGKALLPLLGGAPAVWNTAMMFFQLVLLAGYIYAHALARLGRRWQALLHGGVLLAAFLVLPFADTARLVPPAEGASPVLWLVLALATTVGLPFFAVSATAPLLQSWFKGTGHRFANDPYFLYAASNLGSLIALLGFPLVLEPALTIGGQARAWAGLYAILVALLAVCLYRAPGLAAQPPASSTENPGWARRATWVFLGFIPSSLLLGVTAYVATDLASVPLLWVMPLALYLLSFIIAFGRFTAPDRIMRPAFMAALCGTFFLLLLAKLGGGNHLPIWVVVPAHFTCFFIVALTCHMRVAALRPPAARLTEFYVFLSIGGALGGIFNALLAPVLFSWTYEYEIVLALACTVGLLFPGNRPLRPLHLLVPILLLLAVGLSPRLLNAIPPSSLLTAATLMAAAGAGIVFALARHLPIAAAAGMAALLGGAAVITDAGALHMDRSFFGVHRVIALENGQYRALMHGNILHGAESTDPAHWRDRLGYYSPGGPIGQIIAALPKARHFGVVGLGTGELACYAQQGQDWRYYEIDPAVLRVARDERYFHFMSECGRDVSVTIADGRLALQAEPDGKFDLLVIDAFSSDAIPMHLLTREAFVLYRRKLAPGGVLTLHVSNRYVKLLPAIAATSAAAGLVGLDQSYAITPAETAAHVLPSEWIALAPDAASLATLAADKRWEPLSKTPSLRPWTDAYSNIMAVIRWH
jgi:hypothetical protein